MSGEIARAISHLAARVASSSVEFSLITRRHINRFARGIIRSDHVLGEVDSRANFAPPDPAWTPWGLSGSQHHTRWVDLDGIDNMRDLGGLPLLGSGSTRYGILFRSSTPQYASASDVRKLVDQFDIRTFIDLRSSSTSQREGHGRLPDAGIRGVSLPMPTGPSVDWETVKLSDLYSSWLENYSVSIVRAARYIAEPQQHAVVVHCTIGKDRSGVFSAVIQDAVGVHPDAIVQDYMMTTERLSRIQERRGRLYPDDPLAMRIRPPEPEVMQHVLEQLHRNWGGGAGYLHTNGLTEQELARLRTRLTTQ